MNTFKNITIKTLKDFYINYYRRSTLYNKIIKIFFIVQIFLISLNFPNID